MFAAAAALLVLAAPETEAGKLLQVAWNSQYEWKEDGVSNVTLDFAWTWSFKGRDGTDLARSGRGHVVVVGDAVARRHYPGLADEPSRARLDGHLDWVLARFARKPFAEEFKDMEWKGPEDAAGGTRKVAAGPRAYLVKGDRLFAEERDQGQEGRPFVVRVDYEAADLRDGYAVVAMTCSYTRDAARTAWRREVQLRDDAKHPAPLKYVFSEDGPRGREEMKIDFDRPTFDAAEPVVLDPAARDALEAAWAKRYTLPDDARIEGEFTRRVDAALDRAGWIDGVKGRFQVWGMDNVLVDLDEEVLARGWGQDSLTTCTEHIRAFFDRLKGTPFDVEFAGCGFRLEQEGKERVVLVVGYRKALGFRLEGDRITGHLDRVGNDEGWWSWRVKDTKQGWLVERMARKVEETKIELRFRYGAKKGMQVPLEFDALGVPRDWRALAAFGVVTYELRKLQVSLPDE